MLSVENHVGTRVTRGHGPRDAWRREGQALRAQCSHRPRGKSNRKQSMGRAVTELYPKSYKVWEVTCLACGNA